MTLVEADVEGEVCTAIEQGMSDKSAEFVEQGTEIYRKV